MEENKKMDYTELVELMNKIYESMGISRDKAKDIEVLKEKLLNEPAMLKVAMGKEDLKKLYTDKAEFDEMTANALVTAIKETYRIREELDKEYNKKFAEKSQEFTEVINKLNRMKARGLSEEQLSWAEKSAETVKRKVNNEAAKIQIDYFDKKAKLQEFEKDIMKFGIELDIEDKLKEAVLNRDEKEDKEDKEEKEEQGKGKQNKGRQNKGEQDEGKQDEGKQDEGKQDEGKQDEGKQDEGKPDEGKQDEGKQDEGKQDQGKQDEGNDLPAIVKFADRHPRLGKITFLAKFMDRLAEKKLERQIREDNFVKGFTEAYGEEPSKFKRFLARHPRIREIAKSFSRYKEAYDEIKMFSEKDYGENESSENADSKVETGERDSSENPSQDSHQEFAKKLHVDLRDKSGNEPSRAGIDEQVGEAEQIIANLRDTDRMDKLIDTVSQSGDGKASTATQAEEEASR